MTTMKKQLRIFGLFMAAMSMMFTMNSCGGDDATSSGGNGEERDPSRNSLVGEWLATENKSYGYEVTVIKFNANGTGSITNYELKATSTSYYYGPYDFTYTISGNQFTMKMEGSTISGTWTTGTYGGSKFISLTIQGSPTVFSELTAELRNDINSFNPVKGGEVDPQPSAALQNGTYIEKNPDMKEYFIVEIDGNDMEEYIVTYGKKRKLIEGKFVISGNQMTIAGADLNGDGVVNDNDKVNITINGDEVKVGEITFVRSLVTGEKLIGRWQSTRTIGAEFDDSGTTILNHWDWTLMGSSTGNEQRDNENIRMLLNNDGTFQSSAIVAGQWTKVQEGTFSYADNRIILSFVDGGKTWAETWKVISVNDSEAIIEFHESDNIYHSYYMKKL